MRFIKIDKIQPGSLWRVKDKLAAYYLYEKPWSYDCWSSCVCGVNFEFDLMIKKNAFMLVKIETVGNRYHFSPLGNKTFYENLNISVET